ncbi:hypothetical protein KY285_000334 [Solanum tuberosum]|nr:hypothetical protein KY284_000374 [Solanum tuberosum]KAH0764463.1 hypothetical protein KY285_000334 [Solanum tuberosum]
MQKYGIPIVYSVARVWNLSHIYILNVILQGVCGVEYALGWDINHRFKTGILRSRCLQLARCLLNEPSLPARPGLLDMRAEFGKMARYLAGDSLISLDGY